MTDDDFGPPQRLPWSIIAAAVLAVVLFALFVVSVLLGRDWEAGNASPSAFGTPSEDPVAVVAEFDRAYREADCALFERLTTPQFRSASQGVDAEGVFGCTRWKPVAAAYTQPDGAYLYSQEILSGTVEGGAAIVFARERELDSGDEYLYRYTLLPRDGRWVIGALVETRE